MNRVLIGISILAIAGITASGVAQQLSEQELRLWNSPTFKRQFIESYKAETDIEPRVTEDEREMMIETLEHIAKEEFDEAQSLLTKNRGESASAVVDFTLGNIHFQREEFAQAAALYQVATEKFPKYRRAHRNLALCYVREAEWDHAIPSLTRVIELGEGDALTYGLLGYAYSNVENHLSAESAYRMANLLEPDVVDWKMGLARSFFKQERYHEAIALTKMLIKDQPNDANLWLLQANAFIGLKEPMRAAENLHVVDQLGRSTPESLNMLGDIYVNEGLFDIAVESYVRAMEMSTDARPGRAMRAANVLVAREAHDETRTLLETIDRLFSTQLDEEERMRLLRLRAQLALAEGKGDEEAQVLEEIVAMNPLDGRALILLAEHADRNDKPERAMFYYERAASIEEFEAEAKVGHAQVLVRSGNTDKFAEAIRLLRSAQQIDPRDSVQKYLEQVERLAK